MIKSKQEESCLLYPLFQIERLRVLHELNYLHNDVKPDNILIGHTDPEQIYLIDFGISTRYLDTHGTHVEKVDTRRFRGSF